MQKLVTKNVFSSVFFNVINLVVRLFLPPLILAFVSLEEYGIWTICFTLITYLNLGAIGITNVYVRYVAEYHSKNEIDKISGLLSTGMVLVTTISFIMLLIFWFLLEVLVQTIFRISPELHSTASVLFFGTAIILVFQVSIGSAFVRMLNGLQQIADTMLVFIVGLLLETLLSVVMLFSGFGIYALLYAMAIRTLFTSLAYIVMSFKAVPNLSISFKNFDRAYFKVFYRFGAVVQLAGLIGTFLNTLDKLLTSSFLSMQATALLGLGSRFPAMAVTVPASISAVFLPATSYMHSQQRQSEMIEMYITGSRTIGLLTGSILGFLAAFSVPIIIAWLGTNPKYQVAATVMTIYTLSQHFHVLTGPGSSFFRGIDKPANNLIYSFNRLFFTGLCVFIGFKIFGISIISISLSIAIATTISAVIYLSSNNYRIGVPQLTFLTKVILPGLVPYGIAYLLYWSTSPWLTIIMSNRWHTAILVITEGVIYSILMIGVIYWIIYTKEEQTHSRDLSLKVIKKIIKSFSKQTNPK
ncbi:MAG: hypothetical protein BWK78_01035 [Thiotrichaceae bacterium IS1]|nr:MAG: hypothetical protein BWK78_01035 [Thiotrichaceae bacterium IS1]